MAIGDYDWLQREFRGVSKAKPHAHVQPNQHLAANKNMKEVGGSENKLTCLQ